jgi:oligopeptide transport system permease protein
VNLETKPLSPAAEIPPAEIPSGLFRFKGEPAEGAPGEAKVHPGLTFGQDARRRLGKNRAAVTSAVILGIIISLAFLAPVLAPRNPNAQNIPHANLPPRLPGVSLRGFNGLARFRGAWVDRYAAAEVPGNVHYPFGTDQFGRDLLSRCLYGTRISLIIAFIAAFLDLTLGIFYGLAGALIGGRTDTLMQRLLEIINGVPNLILVVLMLLIFRPGMLSIVLALTLSSWIPMARIVRAQTLKIRTLEYVQAARALGTPAVRLAALHILPNISGTVIVRAMFSIPTAIFFETFLSFIGVGMKIPNASLGTLLNGGYKVFRIYPYQMGIPAVILCLIMLAFNIFADGLRDAFDPRMKDI